MSRIFWDTNLFVYLFQGHPEFGSLTRQLLMRMQENGDELTTSFLTLAEVQVKARRDGLMEEADAFASAVSRRASLIPFERTAADAYVAVRAKTSVRGPDAVQLACAAASGCRFFVTNDIQLHGIRVPGFELFCVSIANVPI